MVAIKVSNMGRRSISFKTITAYSGEYDDSVETQQEAIDRMIATGKGWDGESTLDNTIIDTCYKGS